MKKFHYRLAALLKLKEHREKERQKELAQAMHKVVRQKERLQAIDGHRRTTLDYQRDSLSGRLSLTQLQACSRYLVKLKGDSLLGRETLRGFESDAEKKRQLLVAASRERETYEKHRDKLSDRHYKEAEQAEAKENDEIALTTYRRKHAG